MKLRNSTAWPDPFLRRMVAWVCRRIDLPLQAVRSARFTNSDLAYRGRAWSSGRILVRIGQASRFPTAAFVRQGIRHPEHADREEALVATTAHELMHLWQFRNRAMRRGMRLEPQCIRTESRVLEAFRENRADLLGRWQARRTAAAKPTLVERRQTAAHANLERWERRLKIAQGKVKKLRSRVRYYERRAAATIPDNPSAAG